MTAGGVALLRSSMFLVLLLFACTLALPAQTDTSARQSIAGLSRQQDSLSRRVDRLNDSVSQAIKTSFSEELAFEMQHPTLFYASPWKDHKFFSFLTALLLAAFVFFAFYLLGTSSLCRDTSFDLDGTLKPTLQRPFSYARVQLFWWTTIIVVCYFWFFAAYDRLLALNSSIVMLLGSGLAVFLFDKTMDNDQIKKNNQELPTRHQDIQDTQGFWTDILSDDNGTSIHRLQAVAFNLIYGIGFLSYFFASLSAAGGKGARYLFLELEPWQLSLLAISDLAYLGLKSSENPMAARGERAAMALRQVTTSKDPIKAPVVVPAE
jgi:hypothetical protein